MQPFPSDFLWGAATAAHQVEGGNRWNDWWEAEEAGLVPHRSGDACAHYERFERDFDLAREWGHNCHRFSLEWSRIEPAEGRFDAEAFDHYGKVVTALEARRLAPVVTLHHFTNPAWFCRRGGWLRPDAPRLFERYVRRVLERLGERVKFWITVNEPTVYALQGYVNGVWPPFVRAKPLLAARVLRHLAEAHRRAYDVIKRRAPAAYVGYAHHALLIEPCDPRKRGDRWCARSRDLLLNGAFLRAIGARVGGRRVGNARLDFLGVNYYTRACVRSTGGWSGRLLGRACSLPHHSSQGATTATGWEIYPSGFGRMLAQLARYEVPLFVTENGIATDDDRLRRRFIEEHLSELAKAIRNGIPVLGYLHWTLMDNFEWTFGTQAKFGLASVEEETLRRVPRESAAFFASVCRENRLP